MRQWTSQDVQTFKEFVRSRGGRVVEVQATVNGGYVFSVIPPQRTVNIVADLDVMGSGDPWSHNIIQEFERRGRLA